MKNIIIISVLFISLYSCKKESNNPTTAGGASSGGGSTILTSHKWVLTHEYLDTTLSVGSNLNQLPLTTTEDLLNPYDTCSLTTKLFFKPNGYWVNIKGINCKSSDPDTSANYTWSVNNITSQIILNGTTLNLLELTPTKCKFGLIYPQKDINNVILYYETMVEVLEPAP